MTKIEYPRTRLDIARAEVLENEKITKRFWTRRKMGLTAVFLVFAASNVDEIDRWRHWDDQGPMVQSFAGCDIQAASQDNVQKQQAEAPVAQAKSVAREVDPDTINFASVIAQNGEYMAAEQERFTMPQSGIEVVIHAPKQVIIDQTAFSELFHAALMLDEEYDHPEVRQLMDCYRAEIIDNRAFAGAVYNVFLAPEPGYCIDAMTFQAKDTINKCDAGGATPPEFEVGLAGLNLDYRLMMLSTSQTGLQANQDISRRLIHESVHAYMALMDQPFRLDPDEKLALYVGGGLDDEGTYIAGKVIPKLYPHNLPPAIQYP